MDSGIPSIDWRKPDYGPVLQWRGRLLDELRTMPDDQFHGVMGSYAQDPVQWVNHWGWTFDPRNPERGLPALVPFVLFPRQAEFVRWMVERWQAREDGLAEKSRDMGASWLCVAVAAWLWMFRPGTVVGIGSRKEDYVDRLGDPSSLFYKLRQFVGLLPPRMRGSYDERKHAPFMRLLNPNNGSSVIGEAGPNIGRGARTSLYLLDEAAFLDQPDATDAALSQTSNCKIHVSTPNGEGNPFWRKRFSGKWPVFVFDWRAQPLDAKLLTPGGWIRMGDVAVGDLVIGLDGTPTKVLAITNQGHKEVFRVVCDDGSSTECCEDHLWSVIPYGNQRAGRREIRKTLPLKELANRFVEVDSRGVKRHLYQIPVASAVDCFPPRDLPLDPYVLGCLLGDGSISSCPTGPHLLTVGDAEIADICRARLPYGCELKHDRGIQYRFSAGASYRGGECGRGLHSPVAAAIRDLGLVGAVSHTKFIPEAYKMAGAHARLELLQGLFDTDGHAPRTHAGAAVYSTTSRRLADDVAFVVQSLGGTASISVLTPQATGKFPGGRVCRRRHEAYRVCVKLPAGVVPFRLSRKVSVFAPAKQRGPRRSIVGIDRVGVKPVQCITVDRADGLYLTDDFIVTHNCDPRKGPDWYERQRATLDPVVLAQEVDRDYGASVSNAFIGGELVTAAMGRGPADVKPMGPLRVGVDVARFGDDKTVLVFRRGRVVTRLSAWGKTDLMSTAGRVKQEVQTYVRGTGSHLEQIAVDTIGLGAGVADALRGWFAQPGVVVDVDSSRRLDDGENYNLRARMWADMRDWLDIAALPNDQDLRADLTALRYSFRQGLLLLEAKDDAKKRGIKSPDRADALALTFAIPGGPKAPTRINPAAVVDYPVDAEVGL